MSEVAAASAASSTSTRPKSKKELRAERKAAKKAEADNAASTLQTSIPVMSLAAIKEEKHRLKKERRKEQLREREKEMRREMRREKNIRKQTRKRRELHAVGGGLDPKVAAERLEQRRQNKKRKKEGSNLRSEESNEGQDRAVFDQVFNGAGEEDGSGARTLELGIKSTDVVVGRGDIVGNKSLVTVAYQLRGGKHNGLIDSSKKFVFRVGKGEVIRGWDIGVLGMAVGGRRKLIVPPKAGYGGQDIGAGPGALLHFDITVISCT